MKERALQVRRPDPQAVRPYDQELVPLGLAGAYNQIDYAVYEGEWPWLPNFNAMTPTKSGRAPGVNLEFGAPAKSYGVKFTGNFLAPTDGKYTFWLTSDAGAQMRVHDALLIDDDFNHNAAETTASILLKKGMHPLLIFYRHKSGEAVLKLEYSGPDIPRQEAPLSAFGFPRFKSR